jgi:ligand-binding SRPBCC domain-containing protein
MQSALQGLDMEPATTRIIGAGERVRTFETELWLAKPIDEIFAFFSDAANLQVLTPPWLHFRILTRMPLALSQGALVEYRIRWRGLPIFWQTEIAVWEPPFRFVDRQIKGPYRLWVHDHHFESMNGGTLMRDRIDYAVPGWLLEPWIEKFIVGPDVRRIFDFRRKQMMELFPHA